MSKLNEFTILNECKTTSMYQKSLECYRDCKFDLNPSHRNREIYGNAVSLIQVCVEDENHNNVWLSIDHGEVKFKQCSCYTYERNGICEHIGAALLKYMRHELDYHKSHAAFIVPAANDMNRTLSNGEDLEDKFYETPVRINVFLDKQEENLELELVFLYDDIKINSIKGSPDSGMERHIKRNITEETRALNIIYKYNFVRDDVKLKYILRDEEALFEFITKGIGELQEIGEIYYSESFRSISVYTDASIKSSVRLTDNDLLKFNFKIEDAAQDELKYIFKALKEKKKFYRLKKGGFLPLDFPELKGVSTLVEFLGIKESDFEKDAIFLRKYNAVHIDQSIRENKLTSVLQRSKSFRELVNNILAPQKTDYEPPEMLKAAMRNYQKTGYKWFKTLAAYGFGGILADEMGMGKTLQAIAFILSESEAGKDSEGSSKSKLPCLIITPTSLVYNWQEEVKKFAPTLNALVISGDRLEREEQRKKIEGCDMVITSYALLRRDIEFYRDMDFLYCFLDEAQNIKNPASVNASSAKEIKAKGYFALTGTPIENSLTELWSIFDFLMPGYLLSFSSFQKKYEIPIVKNSDKIALQELNSHIRPFILRRLKRDNIKELPPKIEHDILVEMTEAQKKLYLAYVSKAKEKIRSEISEQGFDKSKLKILSLLTRLRQICLDPSVFLDNYEGESGKMLALDDKLEESLSEGHRLLLFSQFTSVLKNIGKRLELRGLSYSYLDGATKNLDRIRLVKDFNSGQTKIFLISLKAGGTGLNLTGADVVIHFDPWWNPAVEDQATDRAHRIGQNKVVEVIRLIARGTIEEKIQRLKEKKKQIFNDVILDEEVMLSQFSREEFENLFM